MARTYRQKPSDVTRRRIACADTGRPPSGSGLTPSPWARSDTLLALSGTGGDGQSAARAVARYLTRAGCRGRKCGYGEHAGHLALRDQLLDALGLAGGDQG